MEDIMQEKLIIKGAQEHNLKNVDLELSKNQLIVFTGVSGSGKSSLAFDTIYTEGQRRYVESLSNYTKQFLGVMKKPKIDSIEGLSPAISIEQKTSSSNPRSTVGTVTEIFDFIRMLYARIGHQYCHQCGSQVSSQSLDEIITDIFKTIPENGKFLVISPYIEKQRGNLKNAFDYLKASGFHRIILNGEELTLDDEITVDAKKNHRLHVIVDRMVKKDDIASRLAESVETALNLADGNLIIKNLNDNSEKHYSEKNYCQQCQISFPDLSPNSFSFNTPAGMCPSCHGLGYLKGVNVNKLITKPDKSIHGGAIPFIVGQNIEFKKVAGLFAAHNIETKTPLNKIPEALKMQILYGTDKAVAINYESKTFKGVIKHKFEGLVNTIERRYKETSSGMARAYYEIYMSDQPCESCKGNRLRPESLSVRVYDTTITDIGKLEIDKLLKFITKLPAILSEKENFIVKELHKELMERLSFLENVGLQYLSLDRGARTLSGGEAQRIRLASQIASGLTGVIYVLDEPSIGLHQKDNQRLLSNLIRLKEKGNTVLVVEHDRETIEAADTIVDFGPQAGVYGGEIIYNGNYLDLKNTPSQTSDYIFRRKNVEIPAGPDKYMGEIILEGVKTNNLKNISARFPFGKISIVTGVSGAGKSSLVMDTLYNALRQLAKNKNDLDDSDYHKGEFVFDKIHFKDADNKQIENYQPRLIKIDQTPIGRTPRSNPITYIGAFDEIRDIMALTKLSKMRGYTKSRFSFNVKGGRCEKCQGSGVIKIEMHFLADVYVECDICKGKRYNAEALEVKFKEKNINDILNMDIQEAYSFFENIPALKRKLGTLMAVGMGYVKLGQPSTTLSGGEAQRIKLAKELSRTRKEGTIYILDEPTTGLHFQDIQHLLTVLHELREGGSTIIIIEHNMDVIVNADHLIDLGPEGGPAGGDVIFAGSIKQILKAKNSYTADEVRKELKSRKEV